MKESILIVEDEFIVAGDLSNILERAGYTVCAIVDTVDAAREAVGRYHPKWVFLDIFLQDDSMGIDLAPYLRQEGIGFIYISANTNQSVLDLAKATQPYGFLVKPFREKDLLLMLAIAQSKHDSIVQLTEQRELFLRESLLSLVDEHVPFEARFHKTPAVFQPLIPFDYLVYDFRHTGKDQQNRAAFRRIGLSEYQTLSNSEAETLGQGFYLNAEDEKKDKAAVTRVYAGDKFAKSIGNDKTKSNNLADYGFASSLQFGFQNADGNLQLAFFSTKDDAYDHNHEALLFKSARTIHLLFRQLSKNKSPDDSRLKRTAKIPAIKERSRLEGIIGNSPVLLNVLDDVELVAGTNVSVLILGESGTGKEKIAHKIHLSSPRRTKPFVTINCAALPSNLVESELFGHEKGAFTGAGDKRIGKFEAAAGGTIFLDEIGELPLESQVKLLRVIQEKHFEPIGSSKTIDVDVRVVAATNRNLEKEVGEGRFRLDLFYRLNVFPITLPPLRERGQDIVMLATHFLEYFSVQMGRTAVPILSSNGASQLLGHRWPGNIRELEHLIQRTLIKTKGPVIDSFEIPATASGDIPIMAESNKTLDQVEMEYILAVLKTCRGKINGPEGAARILGLHPSTLNSRMKKMGIKKSMYFDQ